MNLYKDRYSNTKSIILVCFFLLLMLSSLDSNAQIIVADSGFSEMDMGYRVHKNTLNINTVLKPILHADHWDLSPIPIQWSGYYWGGQDTLKDTAVFVLSDIKGNPMFFPSVIHNSLPPPWFCPDDTINGLMFYPGGLNSGACIALRLAEPLKQGSSYRIPFVYAHEGFGRATHFLRGLDSLKFKFTVFSADTSEVFIENNIKNAPSIAFDTIGNYEYIEEVPFAYANSIWSRHWMEFTASAAQDGNDWLIIHAGFYKGVIMNFVDAKAMIDLPYKTDTALYCSDTLAHLAQDTIVIWDTGYVNYDINLFLNIHSDTVYYEAPDANGCRLADYRQIVYLDKEALTLQLDSFCLYDSMELVASTGQTTPTSTLWNTGASSDELFPTSYLWSSGATTDTIMVLDSGQYIVSVSKGSCLFNDTIDISHYLAPDFFLGADTFVCIEDSINIGTSTPDAVSFIWNSGENTSHVFVDSTMLQILTITNLHCSSSDTILVTQRLLPTINLLNDTTFCTTDSVSIDASQAGITNYTWTDGVDNPVRWISQAGLYQVSFSDGYCQGEDSILAYTDIPIPFSLGDDTSFCEGGDWSSDFTSLGADEYTWHTSSSLATYSGTTTEEIRLIVRNGTCYTYDTMSLTVHPYPIFSLMTDTLICETDSVQIGTTVTADSLKWDDGSRSSMRWVSTSGEYKLEVSNNGCVTRDSFVLSTDLLQELSLPQDTILCSDKNLFVDGSTDNGTAYLWNDGSASPSRWLDTAGKYSLVVTTRSCGDISDSISVEIKTCNCDVYIPNAFTPNTSKDNLNSTFRTNIPCAFSSYQMDIYNRWGERIFSSSDPQNAWDGVYQGEPVQQGSYIYQVQYQIEGERVTHTKGVVTLLR